jgi:hypothetical protein
VPKKFALLGRCTVAKPPMAARSLPEDERWKTGCEGRPGARDMREPDVVRTWFVVCGACCRFEFEVERFIAEAGMGMAETLLLMGPSV